MITTWLPARPPTRRCRQRSTVLQPDELRDVLHHRQDAGHGVLGRAGLVNAAGIAQLDSRRHVWRDPVDTRGQGLDHLEVGQPVEDLDRRLVAEVRGDVELHAGGTADRQRFPEEGELQVGQETPYPLRDLTVGQKERLQHEEPPRCSVASVMAC
jgi:hypothetical protein